MIRNGFNYVTISPNSSLKKDIVNSGEVGDVVTSRRLPTITN
ncbi:hypothetical protein [Candidatus Tisiphia endosymbiont of Sialis lutaria]